MEARASLRASSRLFASELAKDQHFAFFSPLSSSSSLRWFREDASGIGNIDCGIHSPYDKSCRKGADTKRFTANISANLSCRRYQDTEAIEEDTIRD